MALGSFAEGFAKGFASTYAIKLQEEKEERLLKKTFLQEQKKLQLAKEEKSKQNKSAAMGVQEMYGLTEAQANTLFVRLDTGMITPDKLDDLARQFAAQNSRQKQTVETSPVIAEGVPAPASVSASVADLTAQTEIMLGNKKEKIDAVEPSVTSKGRTTRSVVGTPSVVPALSAFTASDQLAAIYNPQLTNASFLDSTMDSAADYRNEVFKAGDKWFYGLKAEDKSRVFKDTQEEYLWRSALAKDPTVLLKDTDRQRPIKRGQPPEQNFLETAYDSTLAFLGFGESRDLEEVPPPADYAITEQLAAQEEDLLKINGMTQKYIEETRPARLKDLQEKYLATPRFEDVDPQTLEDLTTVRSIGKLMENEDFKKYWLNHLTQKEYQRFIDNGDTDGVARTRTLISMTAGPDMADYWDGTDIGAQRLAAQLDRFEGGAVIKNEEFGGREMFGKPLSQGESMRQVLAQARNSGMLPPEEQFVSEAKEAEKRRVDQDKLLKRHGISQKVLQYKAQNATLREAPAAADSGATATRIRATEPAQASLVTDGVELTPNMVGAQFTGMPYVKAGLARMPTMAKAIEPLDFTKFKDMSPALLEQQALQYDRLAAIATNQGNSADAAMYTEYGGALHALSASIGQKQDAFLTTPIHELDPEQVGRNLFLVRDYISSPPAGATPEQLNAARRRESTLEKLVQYDFDNDKFDPDLFLKDPDLYVAIRKTNPERYNKVDEPVIKRWANSQVTDIDFSKLTGAESLPMIAVHVDAVDKALASTTKEGNPILYASLTQTRSKLKAAAQGINESLRPKELNLSALGQDYLIAATAEKVAQENMDRLGAKVVKETDGQIQLADHPEYRESLKIHAEAEATAQAKLALLQDGIKIHKLINPEKAEEYKWASTLEGIRAQKVDVGNQLSAATSPEEIQKLSKRHDTLSQIESVYVSTANEKAQITARANNPNKLMMVIDPASGFARTVSVPTETKDGSTYAGGITEYAGQTLYDAPQDLAKTLGDALGRDTAIRERINTDLFNLRGLNAVGGKLIDTANKSPVALTSVGGGIATFVQNIENEIRGLKQLIDINAEDRRVEGGQEGDFLIYESDINNIAAKLEADLVGQGVGQVARDRARLQAQLMEFVFKAGAIEGQSGAAMSNRDFDRLLGSFKSKDPQEFPRIIESYVNRATNNVNGKITTFNDNTSNIRATYATAPLNPKIIEALKTTFDIKTFAPLTAGYTPLSSEESKSPEQPPAVGGLGSPATLTGNTVIDEETTAVTGYASNVLDKLLEQVSLSSIRANSALRNNALLRINTALQEVGRRSLTQEEYAALLQSKE